MSNIPVHQILREVRHLAWTPVNPDGTTPELAGAAVAPAAHDWQPIGYGRDLVTGAGSDTVTWRGDMGQMLTLSGYSTQDTIVDHSGDGDDAQQMRSVEFEVPQTPDALVHRAGGLSVARAVPHAVLPRRPAEAPVRAAGDPLRRRKRGSGGQPRRRLHRGLRRGHPHRRDQRRRSLRGRPHQLRRHVDGLRDRRPGRGQHHARQAARRCHRRQRRHRPRGAHGPHDAEVLGRVEPAGDRVEERVEDRRRDPPALRPGHRRGDAVQFRKRPVVVDAFCAGEPSNAWPDWFIQARMVPLPSWRQLTCGSAS